jgi:glycosyltransferase involved in cell wall biosynthesis
MPRASVIITTNNRPALLPRAVESARAAGREIEVVVVDDASADETADTCRRITGIKYVRVDRNQGVAGARNIGLVASSGEYVTFLDDDDLRVSGSLDNQIRILDQTPDAMMIYGQAIPETASGERRQPYPRECPQGDIFWELLIRNFIPSGSVVFRRACISQIGLIDDSLPGIDDWDLWIRIAEIFPVAAIETPVLIWRQSTATSAQGSSDALDLIERGRRRFRQEWVRLPRVAGAEPEKRKFAWRAFSKNIAEHLAWESFAAVRTAQISRASRGLRTLLQLHPAALAHLARRWTSASTTATLVSTLVDRAELPNAREHFKQVRSNISDDENYSLQEPP